MSGSLATALPFIIIGIVMLAVAVWLLMRLNATTFIVDASEKRDVLDEGAAPAQRNQALIDAPAAVANNFGETSAVANTRNVAAASQVADAEAGALVVPESDLTQAPASPAQTADAPHEPAVPKIVTDGVMSDDLAKLKGVGPKLVTLLNEQGITSFAQIAAWTESDIAKVDDKLGRFKGRITRDQWVEQAKLLISDDKTAYAAKFGQNG